MEEEKKKSKVFFILLILVLIVIVLVAYFLISAILEEQEDINELHSAKGETTEIDSENEYVVEDNKLSKFDLSFLKFENEEENKIYSPLSIKYAFKMLEEATSGKAHEQIAEIIEAYNLTKYESNENMALANAFFVRDSYKENIKESYINALKTKYNADVQFDDFKSAQKINFWVKNHTLNLIPDLLQDSDVTSLDFVLVNALGIDMEWNHKFLKHDYEDDSNIVYSEEYYHERLEGEKYGFYWESAYDLVSKEFNDGKQKVSAMRVDASFNNYDIVGELGEDKIYEIVYADFHDWALGTGIYAGYGKASNALDGDFSEENIKKVFDDWYYYNKWYLYDGGYSEENNYYINTLKSNYGKEAYSTDFSVYVNDDVKVFAKDLKEYDGTTLQYVGIMPKNEELSNYVNSVTHEDIQDLIDNLKDMKKENFKDGYVTYIHGYIPKFSFEYDLDLQNDLEKMGVTDVFEQGKANLTKMTDDKEIYITEAKHKANIEFTQDGITAAATTVLDGGGGGDGYDYFFEVPTEDIDITFDKPYMFLVRDKSTGETWFVGTVYEPLNADEDTTSSYISEAWEDMDNNIGY